MTAPPALSAAHEQDDQEDAPPITSGAQALTERSLDIFSAIFKGNLQIIQEKDATISRQADTIADLRERAGRAEARLETRVAAWEQAVIDYGEQAERAIRAEAERDALAASLARQAGRRWRWKFWERI